MRLLAGMVESADTQDLKSCELTLMRVQVPLSAYRDEKGEDIILFRPITCAVIHVKEKTLKHGVQFRHERKGCVNYRDYPGCILRY